MATGSVTALFNRLVLQRKQSMNEILLIIISLNEALITILQQGNSCRVTKFLQVFHAFLYLMHTFIRYVILLLFQSHQNLRL